MCALRQRENAPPLLAQEFVELAEERLASPLGKQRMIERTIYVEGVIGLAKELHGLRRTRFRGRWRVQIQVWLTAAAMNIKRAVRTIGHTGWPTAPARLLAQFFALAMPSSRGQAVPGFSGT